MASNRGTLVTATPPLWYKGGDVPLRVIRRYVRQVAEKFRPDQIILFGSHAHGTPREDSDVDLLVVMPCRNELNQMARIALEVPAPFPEDLIVLKPQNVKWRLEEGESFLTEIMRRGKVLYEKNDARVGAQGRSRLPSRRTNRVINT